MRQFSQLGVANVAEQIHEDIKKYVFDTVLPADMVDEDTKFFINPTGRFVIGGPNGDSGLTGRKIIVDTYGGYARHGGGAFSGKDCMARAAGNEYHHLKGFARFEELENTILLFKDRTEE